MKYSIGRITDWLEQRTGLGAATESFLRESIPGSAGWAQVFGSVALFLLLTQAFTGILLSLNYAPAPGDAYNSVVYIMRDVALGRMVRGLHHWGSSLMLIVVVLHMIQVFVFGAYKEPREVTWMIGVILLFISLTFGLTGYLLPWDNRAYWGTLVTTRIMGQAPAFGRYFQHLVGADEGIGVVTFSRFYALHVLILPAAMILFVAAHVALVRKHGVTPTASEDSPRESFFPGQVFRDTVAVFIAFVLLFLSAAFLDVPLEHLADPTDAGYVPRPEWYFLFLFQSLKYFSGALEPVGTVGLPTLAVLLLFAVPLIDQSAPRRLRQRAVAISLVLLCSATWGSLTYAAIQGSPKKPNNAPIPSMAFDIAQLSPEEIAGYGYFRQEQCATCHNLVDGNPKPGPNLAGIGRTRRADWMIEHFKNPNRVMPGSNMPPIHLNPQALNALAAMLLKLTPENASRIDAMPDLIVEGAKAYVDYGCPSCHSVNGLGGEMAPQLNGIGSRRTKEWIDRHFEAPGKVSPGSIMPPYRFTPVELSAIDAYLLSLQ